MSATSQIMSATSQILNRQIDEAVTHVDKASMQVSENVTQMGASRPRVSQGSSAVQVKSNLPPDNRTPQGMDT